MFKSNTKWISIYIWRYSEACYKTRAKLIWQLLLSENRPPTRWVTTGINLGHAIYLGRKTSLHELLRVPRRPPRQTSLPFDS